MATQWSLTGIMRGRTSSLLSTNEQEKNSGAHRATKAQAGPLHWLSSTPAKPRSSSTPPERCEVMILLMEKSCGAAAARQSTLFRHPWPMWTPFTSPADSAATHSSLSHLAIQEIGPAAMRFAVDTTKE